MKKKQQKTQRFQIALSKDELLKPYSLTFSGLVIYNEYPPDYSCKDSDIDYYGYKEYVDTLFNYITLEDDYGVCDDLQESEVPLEDFQLFSTKLNILVGF